MTAVIRSLAVNTISSTPLLLAPSLTLMAFMANSHNVFLNPDRNPLLRWFLKRTFYAQYCGGENAPELQRTVQGLKKMGYEGVILVYAKEVEIDHTGEEPAVDARMEATSEALADIETWKNGTLETVRLAEKGDMVALKYVPCLSMPMPVSRLTNIPIDSPVAALSSTTISRSSSPSHQS
jgi:hypothetical protein